MQNKKLIIITAIVIAVIIILYIIIARSLSGKGEEKKVEPEITYDDHTIVKSTAQPLNDYAWLRQPETKSESPSVAPWSPPQQNAVVRGVGGEPGQKPEKKQPKLLVGEVDFDEVQDQRPRVQPAQFSPGQQEQRELPAYAEQGLAKSERDFISSAGNRDKGVNPGRKLSPAGPYIIQTGRIIQATAENAATTDLPGYLVSKINRDVYDSVTGRCVLIPAGSKIIGPVNNQVSYGADRAQLASTRIHFPNGGILDLDTMPGTDAKGMAGVEGHVNHHYGSMSLAILGDIAIKMLGQLGQLTNSGNGEVTVIGVGGNSAASSVSDVGGEIVRKELDRPNTVVINQFDPVSLLVIRDLVLPPIGGCQ